MRVVKLKAAPTFRVILAPLTYRALGSRVCAAPVGIEIPVVRIVFAGLMGGVMDRVVMRYSLVVLGGQYSTSIGLVADRWNDVMASSAAMQ